MCVCVRGMEINSLRHLFPRLRAYFDACVPDVTIVHVRPHTHACTVNGGLGVPYRVHCADLCVIEIGLFDVVVN